MKKYIICSLFLSMTLASCDDFFSPETEDALSSDDYLSSLTQMANGYLGVLTSMQTVGDKEIYITDTRGDMLEPTEQCIAPLIALYNYVDDLSGNAYADPAGYYDVIIACNDYLYKMQEFRAKYPELVDETDYFPGLYASAIRVKAWAYMTLAEIYGQALWFDDPIHASKDVNDTNVFTLMQTQEIVQKCISMLNTDVTLDSKMTISPKEKFSWISWVDVEHVTAVAQSSYRYWDMMTPDFEPLMGKLQLWNAACLQRDGHIAEANAAYEAVLDNLLPYLQKYWAQYSHYWKRCPTTPGHLSAFWNNATPYQEEVVSAIIYDYTKNQTNKLLYHFSNEYPNKYLLRSNEACRERYTDPTFNPSMGEGDKRLGLTTKEVNGQWCISKYRPNANVRANAYQDDVHIYTFRCSELFLWIAEALNHLGRYEAMNRVINTGFAATDYDMLMHLQNEEWDEVSEANQKEFKGFDSYWAIPSSVDKYGTYTGFRGCLDNLLPVDVWTEMGHTAEEAQRHNDDLLAKEWTLEFPAEGKTYPNLIRFAERYNDPAIVSDIVTLKYGDKASTIAAKIQGTNLNGTKGYYVPWKLK
jgi:hypothetical protein